MSTSEPLAHDHTTRSGGEGSHRVLSTGTANAPLPSRRVQSVRDQAVEQAMRGTGDDTLVVSLLMAEPRSPAAHAALGRLLGEPGIELVAGCPLLAFVAGTPIEEGWRLFCPPVPGSLWQSREFLSSLYGTPVPAGPYQELESLRAREDQDFDDTSALPTQR